MSGWLLTLGPKPLTNPGDLGPGVRDFDAKKPEVSAATREGACALHARLEHLEILKGLLICYTHLRIRVQGV